MKALGLCSIVREEPLILSAVLAGMANDTYMMALSSSGGGRHLQDCCVCDSGERKLTPASVAWLWCTSQAQMGGRMLWPAEMMSYPSPRSTQWLYCTCSEVSVVCWRENLWCGTSVEEEREAIVWLGFPFSVYCSLSLSPFPVDWWAWLDKEMFVRAGMLSTCGVSIAVRGTTVLWDLRSQFAPLSQKKLQIILNNNKIPLLTTVKNLLETLPSLLTQRNTELPFWLDAKHIHMKYTHLRQPCNMGFPHSIRKSFAPNSLSRALISSHLSCLNLFVLFILSSPTPSTTEGLIQPASLPSATLPDCTEMWFSCKFSFYSPCARCWRPCTSNSILINFSLLPARRAQISPSSLFLGWASWICLNSFIPRNLSSALYSPSLSSPVWASES